MKLFDPTLNIIRIDDIFPMFLVENWMKKTILPFSLIELTLGGWGNGYVGLPKWHPLYGIHYDDINISCHGGLTYSELDEDEDLWLIGFDTHHYGDDINTCNFEYVKNETYNLMMKCYKYPEVFEKMRYQKLLKLKNKLWKN
jgi:hypothetical protein